MSWSRNNNKKFQYVSSDNNNNNNNNNNKNNTVKYANNIMKSEMAIVNGNLYDDYNTILKGGCAYIPNFFCDTPNYEIFHKLKSEIDILNMVNWSKHFKYENPEFSETFNDIVKKMEQHFNVKVMQTRLNYYKDGNDWKPLHHDRHAYGEGKDKIREDFTMGATFGATRALEFVHDETKLTFSFPQNNGDVFAFNADVNKKFMHGVPKIHKPIGERFSVIAWGKKINS